MQERRNLLRTKVFKAARLFGRTKLGDGIVRDISANGARLEMVSTSSIPGTFDLSFDDGRTLRFCRVIWRKTTELGLHFAQGAFRAAALRHLVQPKGNNVAPE